jgi:hypothetical protein
MKRALTITDIRSYKATTYRLEGGLGDALGEVELTGSWIVWGGSANGKTRFALQLAKALAKHVRVAYDSLEEGLSLSMRHAIEAVGFSDVKRNFVLLDGESIDDLKERLRKQRSPKVVIIDSLQYTGLTYNEYKRLRDEFRQKLFIFISHADGHNPKGAVADSVKYDAFVKIFVEGYRAYPQSRFGGGEPYTVWPEGAAKYGHTPINTIQ